MKLIFFILLKKFVLLAKIVKENNFIFNRLTNEKNI